MDIIPKVGDTYKIFKFDGVELEVKYVPRDDEESDGVAPEYPDFFENPVYTAEGCPLRGRFDEPCDHYKGEKWDGGVAKYCEDCKHFRDMQEYIGVCRCAKNKFANPQPTKKFKYCANMVVEK